MDPALPINQRTISDSRLLLLLALVVLLLHGHTLSFGFFFDDHNHLEHCHRDGYAGLASGNTFDWTGNIVRVWWASEKTGWAYFRPLTVALRTTWLRLFGLNPLPWHLIHLGLYLAAVLLLYAVPRRLGCDRRTALVAALFFTIHPAHAQVAPWLANDGPILTVLCSLVAVWLWHNASDAGKRRPIFLAGVFLCYACAMLSRENGIMLGPMLILYDLLAANRLSRRKPWGVYLVLASLAVVYLAVRSCLLPPAPLPRSPYVHWPSEPGFFAWLPYKFLNNVLCLTLGLPFVPIADVPWMVQRPWTTLLALLSLVGVTAVIFLPLRRSRAAWGVLAATCLAAGPTVLCFSAAYNYYAVSAGWAVLLALWAQQMRLTRPRLVTVTLGGLGVVYLVFLWAGVWQMRTMNYADHCVRQDVLAAHPETFPQGTSLFFINLPLFGMETGPALRLETDRPDLQVFPLTLAPEPFCPMHEATLKQEDERTLLVSLASDGWFSGAVGEGVQLAWFGRSLEQLPLGQVNILPAAGKMPFRVEVVRRDEHGISSLRFIFEKPLDDPGYRFFVGNRCRYAMPLFQPAAKVPVLASPEQGRMSARMQRMQSAHDRVVNLLGWCP